MVIIAAQIKVSTMLELVPTDKTSGGSCGGRYVCGGLQRCGVD